MVTPPNALPRLSQDVHDAEHDQALAEANQMTLAPTEFDLRAATRFLRLLGQHPLFDRAVQSGLRHGILGGLWYAAAVFLVWTRSLRPGGEQLRERLITTFLASLLAAVIAVSLGLLFPRTPPNRYPGLMERYPEYIEPNPNESCFPSYSVAFLVPVAAGVFSLWRSWGAFLWLGVPLLVGLPRIYVGGHFPTDVLAGIAVGAIAYVVVTHWERRVSTPLARIFERRGWISTAAALVMFFWILETASDFREAVWIRESVAELFLR
jgi:membrane-associated phospholipid phosphatase